MDLGGLVSNSGGALGSYQDKHQPKKTLYIYEINHQLLTLILSFIIIFRFLQMYRIEGLFDEGDDSVNYTELNHIADENHLKEVSKSYKRDQ